MPIAKDIQAYNAAQSPVDKRICEALAKFIDGHLPGAECKIWHAHPVWFLAGNPIVGYSKLKDSVRLLFWSGQSFEEPGLVPEGSFKAAEARYTAADQISKPDLERWLEKAVEIQWDYKNIVKRRGRLERLEPSDWRVETLEFVRGLIKQAVPGVVEEVKWRKPANPAGVPVWSVTPTAGDKGGSVGGMICTGETYKDAVKLTFVRGAGLPDPRRLFNSSLEGSARRAIDILAGEKLDAKWEAAFKALVKAAASLVAPSAKAGPAAKKAKSKASAGKPKPRR